MPVNHHETGNTYYKIGFILDQSSDYKKAINYYMIALWVWFVLYVWTQIKSSFEFESEFLTQNSNRINEFICFKFTS